MVLKQLGLALLFMFAILSVIGIQILWINFIKKLFKLEGEKND